MRLATEGIPSPYAFAELLPAIFQEDEFARRFVAGFDDVLSPLVAVLDNIAAYFDPRLAPSDFVSMLAGWVGVELDETWNDDARRELVARAVALLKLQGTVEGLRQLVEIYTGVSPEIDEGGACVASEEPTGAIPGRAGAPLVVRVRVADATTIDRIRLDRLVAAAKPAHIRHEVEVVGR